MRETGRARPARSGAGDRSLRRRAAAAATLAGGLAVASAPGGAAAAARPAGAGAEASWRIIKTTRGRDLPGITAVTATGTRRAWAFASTLARPVAWRLTGRAWTAVPFPGRAGHLVTVILRYGG